jgi:hypothetical protein
VIDQTTLRLWDLPRDGVNGGDSASATLKQAGTGEAVTIDFVRLDGLWYLQAPSLATLGATAERLRAARSGAEGTVAGGALSSPRETMKSFLTGFGFAADGSDPATLAALDLRGRPEVTKAYDGQVLAGYLRRVIDRAGYVLWQEIPDDPTALEPYIHFQHPEGNIVIGEVVHVHVDDAAINERLHLNPDVLDLVGRLGGLSYCRTRDRFDLRMGR